MLHRYGLVLSPNRRDDSIEGMVRLAKDEAIEIGIRAKM
jgi:hypothetical protein